MHGLIASCVLPAGGGALAVRRPSGRRPLELIVVSLGVRARETLPQSVVAPVVAIVFLRDPEMRQRPMPELLRDLYGLTPAEARLAVDLLAHRSLEEIADQRRVSRETLRTQVKVLFRKTGTSRQAELTAFLAAGIQAVL